MALQHIIGYSVPYKLLSRFSMRSWLIPLVTSNFSCTTVCCRHCGAAGSSEKEDAKAEDKDWDFCKFLYHKIKAVPEG